MKKLVLGLFGTLVLGATLFGSNALADEGLRSETQSCINPQVTKKVIEDCRVSVSDDGKTYAVFGNIMSKKNGLVVEKFTFLRGVPIPEGYRFSYSEPGTQAVRVYFAPNSQ